VCSFQLLCLLATRRQEVLALVAGGLLTSEAGGQDGSSGRSSSSSVSVERRVYASPTHTTVNLKDARAAGPPQPSYPEIYFAVDDFDNAFADLVSGRQLFNESYLTAVVQWHGKSISRARLPG
jgi:hypothetical protein